MACDKCSCVIRVRYCGQVWEVIADGNDDGVLEIGFEPRIVAYTGNAPDPGDAIVVPDPANTSVLPSGVFAVNSGGVISHVAICGTWLPLGGGTVAPPAGTTERICYPVGDTNLWTFPATFGGECDSWMLDGVELAQDACPLTPVSYCPDSSLQTFYGSGSQGAPSAGWGSLSWDPGPASSVGCAGEVTNMSNRVANRWQFSGSVPAGATADQGIVTYSAEYLAGDGTMFFGVYDPASDSMLPIASWTAPGGAVVSIQGGGTELRSYPQSGGGGQGLYQVTVDSTGYVLEDLEFVVWQIGDTDSTETVGNPQMAFTAPVDEGCLTWTGSTAIAGWMNNNTPNGEQAVWFVDGDGNVCADIPIGTFARWGDLVSCDGQSVSPSLV